MSRVIRAIDAKSFIIGVLSAVIVVMAMGAQFSISAEATRGEWRERGWLNNVPILTTSLYKPRTAIELSLVDASRDIEVRVVKVGPNTWRRSENLSVRGDGINGAWAPFAVSGTPESPEFIYLWRVPDKPF